MRVVFEDAGWQIVDHGAPIVYMRHMNCKTYVTYALRSTNNRCTGCYTIAPNSIQTLTTLYNGGYE